MHKSKLSETTTPSGGNVLRPRTFVLLGIDGGELIVSAGEIERNILGTTTNATWTPHRAQRYLKGCTTSSSDEIAKGLFFAENEHLKRERDKCIACRVAKPCPG